MTSPRLRLSLSSQRSASHDSASERSASQCSASELPVTRRTPCLRALGSGGLALLLLSVTAISTFAKDSTPPRTTQYETYSSSMERVLEETPLPSRAAESRAVGDTTYFGYVDASGFAIPGETWTWDHGHPTDPLEGWTVRDVTEQTDTYFRHIDAASWNAPESGNLVPPPILVGNGSAWGGAFESEADTLCWAGGLGYGNNWTQRLASPVLDYTGSGGVNLQFTYFNDTEPEFDYTRVLLRLLPSGVETSLNGEGFNGPIGLATDHPTSPPVGETVSFSMTELDLGGTPQFQVVFEFDSDGGWSDQDAEFTTEYGPFAVDAVQLSGAFTGSPMNSGFESSLDGWMPEAGSGNGAYALVGDVSLYDIQDACVCGLSGNVLAMHDSSGGHPDGQRQYLVSNTVDLTSVPDPGSGERIVLAYWDQYSELPIANGVFYRPGWEYYPYTCPNTGIVGWSPRSGLPTFSFVGEDPLCTQLRNNATQYGIPQTAEQIRFIFELYSSCSAFDINPCSGETNETPILDNVRIAVTYQPIAPDMAWDNGFYLWDGFSQGNVNDPFDPGNADCVRNTNFGSTPPIVLEDAPSLNGPVGTSNPWDARFHFRVKREGPGASHANFAPWAEWKSRTGVGIGPSSNFAYGFMDTFEVAGNPINTLDIYDAYYREDDPNNPSPGTELVDANEILVDNVPPGTMIEYFASAYFRATPGEVSTLPDTTGGNFQNFEILPHWRDDGGVLKYPSILYIDAYNRGTEYYIASALDQLGYEYDIFDRLDSSCCWSAPFARGLEPESNNGMTVAQLQGYKAVLFNAGNFNSAVWPEDGRLLSDYLTAEVCGVTRRTLVVNGDAVVQALGWESPSLLANRLGAALAGEPYIEVAGDPNYCVDLEPATGALYGTSNSINGSYDYGAWGNNCPVSARFNVINTVGTGVGNRVYVNTDTGTPTQYAQVVNVDQSATTDYRTVIDGVSWHHMAEAPSGGLDPDCEPTAASVITAAANEIAAALEWVFDGTIPGLTQPDCDVTGAPDPFGEAGQVTRLYANQPNPFNPRTTLRFTLSTRQETTLAIYDVGGRRVRTLIDAELEGGPHEIVWDGTDDAGHALASGVYWSQLVTDDFRGSKKMIVLD